MAATNLVSGGAHHRSSLSRVLPTGEAAPAAAPATPPGTRPSPPGAQTVRLPRWSARRPGRHRILRAPAQRTSSCGGSPCAGPRQSIGPTGPATVARRKASHANLHFTPGAQTLRLPGCRAKKRTTEPPGGLANDYSSSTSSRPTRPAQQLPQLRRTQRPSCQAPARPAPPPRGPLCPLERRPCLRSPFRRPPYRRAPCPRPPCQRPPVRDPLPHRHPPEPSLPAPPSPSPEPARPPSRPSCSAWSGGPGASALCPSL
mmetsp:Transcript_51470/g.135860  ORF Transcript_51470/g.135860 Transcript_51470/m.135860 type:complete len:258 (-) Transcript_51470:441-1214(-)